MQLNLNLKLDQKDQQKKEEKIKAATKKKELVKYVPTWNEVWHTGYTTHTGSVKKGIYQTKLVPNDLDKLSEVQTAIEQGELGSGVEDLRKFTKTHALNLYKQLIEIRKADIIKKMVENKPDNYLCIRHHAELDELLFNLAHEDLIAVDTETTGVDVWGSSIIVGISFTLPKADKHYYIPVRHNLPDKQLDPGFVFGQLRSFLQDPNLKKIMHNAKFDIHMLRKEGIQVQGLWMDTMVAMHLLNENEMSFALKNLATKYGEHFGFEDKSATYEQLFGKCGFENTPLDIGTVYACKDTHLTYKFAMWINSYFEKMPQIKDLYFNVELPITMVCVEMEKNGFAIDLDFAAEYKEELQQKIQQLQKDISEGFGDININSNQQLADVIYNQWKVQDTYKGSVDASTLKTIVVNWERHIPQVRYIRSLLDYRGLNKLLTTYIEPLPQKVAADKRLHGSFNQSATATGRFASNNPNLQNLPYDARKLIVAAPGKIIIGIDYSQIEPRVLSHISGDDNLKQPYETGQDLYSTLASRVFKVPLDQCGDGSKYRKMMKTGLLAVMYGTSTFTLSQQLEISQEDAEQFIQDFMESYPDVAAFISGTHAAADTNGFVETLYGRKRRFIGHQPIAKRFKALEKKIQEITKKQKFNVWAEKKIPRDLKTQYWEVAKDYGRVNRQSVNAIIQGSSADIMKIAMVEVEKHLRTKGNEWRLLATIHDEILIELPETAAEQEILEIAEIQKNAVQLSIPFKVDIEVSKRWGCGVPFKEFIKDRSII